MTLRCLASFGDRAGRVRRPQHHGHTLDCGHVELEAPTALQSRRADDLHLGQFVVEAADAVNGVRTEMDVAPEFTDFELGRWRNRANLSTVAAPPTRFFECQHRDRSFVNAGWWVAGGRQAEVGHDCTLGPRS